MEGEMKARRRRQPSCADAMLRQAGARAPRVLRWLSRPLSTARQWKVYLSGEIHSDWREVIAEGVESKGLPVLLTSPNTSHEDSDDCAAIILGMEEKRPNWDRLGATMNSIRTKTLLEDADVVVVRFGEKYRQVRSPPLPSPPRPGLTPRARPRARAVERGV